MKSEIQSVMHIYIMIFLKYTDWHSLCLVCIKYVSFSQLHPNKKQSPESINYLTKNDILNMIENSYESKYESWKLKRWNKAAIDVNELKINI